MIAELGTGSVWEDVSIPCSCIRTRLTRLPRKDSQLGKEKRGLDQASACGTSPIRSARALRRIGQRKVRLDHGSGSGLWNRRDIDPHCGNDTSKCLADWSVSDFSFGIVKAAVRVVLTWKTWVKVSPGPIGHCVTPVGPSMELVPFWKRPWKCRLVVSLPSWLVRCTVICSPTLAVIAGSGHWLLRPMTGLACRPSGFRLTQVTSQLYTAADTHMTCAKAARRRSFGNIMVASQRFRA